MTVGFAIRAPIARADLPGLSKRVCSLLEGYAGEVVLCDVEGVRADAVTVDALARLHVGARRKGCQVRLVGASVELVALVGFMGLADVIVPADGPAGRRAGTACRSTGRS